MLNLNGYAEDTGKTEFGRRDVFSILAILALLAFMMFATTGCGLVSVNGSNFPLFGGSGASVTLKNDSDYVITVVVNRDQMTWKVKGDKSKQYDRLAPGARAPISIPCNWTGYDQTVLITVDGYSDQELKGSVGSDAVSITAGANQRLPYSLRVVNDDRSGVRIEYSGGGFLNNPAFRW